MGSSLVPLDIHGIPKGKICCGSHESNKNIPQTGKYEQPKISKPINGLSFGFHEWEVGEISYDSRRMSLGSFEVSSMFLSNDAINSTAPNMIGIPIIQINV